MGRELADEYDKEEPSKMPLQPGVFYAVKCVKINVYNKYVRQNWYRYVDVSTE